MNFYELVERGTYPGYVGAYISRSGPIHFCSDCLVYGTNVNLEILHFSDQMSMDRAISTAKTKTSKTQCFVTIDNPQDVVSSCDITSKVF